MTREDARAMILDKYGATRSDFLGSGMEAEVYAYGHNRVLKLYNDMSDVNKQNILKDFYAGIDSSSLSYELPYIYDIFVEKDILITIEKRIEGSNLQNVFAEMSASQQSKMMETYLSANLELKHAKVEYNLEGFTLFNDSQVYLPKIDDWFGLLKEIILKKQKELEPYFNKDVNDYHRKVNHIVNVLSQSYKGEYSLIHGDFYPGNLLVDKNGTITGLIDFGLMTMYGDNLFDVAVGWVCFDMYDQLKANIYERYLNVITSTLGQDIKNALYLYVLIYSFISANFYSRDCSDGHYQWCVRNLNNRTYWEII